jgi:hypothetical protein
MPNADKFILCKKFEFTYEEHATMSAGRVQWTETNTFVQATKWVYDTAASGPSQEKPAAKSSESPGRNKRERISCEVGTGRQYAH